MAFDGLDQYFSGPRMRKIMGIRDMGEVILAFFKDPDGAAIAKIADDLSDIWVTLQDAASDTTVGKITARLFTPMNMMFRLPKEDESAVVCRGADVDGPGTAYALYGDCGKAGEIPDWLDSDNSGLSVSETLILESRDKDVTVRANSATGVATVTAPATTGKVALGPVANLSVLVLGAFDSYGVPVTQAPAATNTIVKAG